MGRGGEDDSTMIMKRSISTLGVLAAMTIASSPVTAQILKDELPADANGVGIVDRRDQVIPLDLTFLDHEGDEIQLSEVFEDGKPVIMSLNYYRCPMLCTLTLNGLVEGLSQLEWTIGDEFKIVTVSINPEEGPEMAAPKRRAYGRMYSREITDGGWVFLTGEQDQIESLAKATGFGYRYDEASGEFEHTSSLIFLTPEGRVSQYMNDTKFATRDLRLALVESSEGSIGSAMDVLFLLTCYSYDPNSNSYVASAQKIMRTGGIVTIILIVAGLGWLAMKGPRRGSKSAGDSTGMETAS